MTEQGDVSKGDHPMLSNLSPMSTKKGKVVTAQQAVQLIRDGDTIAMGGFVGIGCPEELAVTIENTFLEIGSPRDLTLVYAAGQGDGKEKGLNHFGHEGLLKKVVGGHWGLAPKLQKLAFENKIQAYNLPQGVLAHMYRDIASKKPRTITTVGLCTFVDPDNGGGKLNDITTEDIVEKVQFDGIDYLAYKPFPINVAVIRGTTADTDGNITMEREALTLESLALAMAVKNSNGFVIVQVERIAEAGSLNPKQVKIPGILVDCIVKSKPEYHWQTFSEQYSPAFSGEIRVPMQSVEPMGMTERKIIARRAAFELEANSVINLGIGMPEGVAEIASEENILEFVTLTAEPGIIGGIPAGGLNFGAGVNTAAVIDQPYQFDFYDGGGLDMAFLGLAQADKKGNLNVSKFGPKLAGAGGFINISQNAKKIVFVGTFTAGGLKLSVENGELIINSEGKVKKFVELVEHVTFSGDYALQKEQPVLFITERCVFKLTKRGMVLTEVAPGVDIEKDILMHMDFRPLLFEDPVPMDARIFLPEPMGLKERMLRFPLEDRLTFDSEKNLFFVNFEGFSISCIDDIMAVNEEVRKSLASATSPVKAIVNYDNFNIDPELVDTYMDMVKRLVEDLYDDVTRYTTSTFMRMKLGEELQKRDVAPHIYETKEEAKKVLS